MNNNAKRWVAAARSGDWTQARGRLRRGKGYCILGVGVELYKRAHGIKNNRWRYARQMPDTVRVWLGLRTAVGRYWGGSLEFKNDEEQWSLFRLAQLIELEPYGLFVVE